MAIPKRCTKCRFSTGVYLQESGHQMRACIYILRTGHRRPVKLYKTVQGCAAFEAQTEEDLKFRKNPG